MDKDNVDEEVRKVCNCDHKPIPGLSPMFWFRLNEEDRNMVSEAATQVPSTYMFSIVPKSDNI